MKRYSAFLALFMVIPYIITACPMCQGGEGFTNQSVFAYKATTALLALLPLLMGTAIFWWVKRRINRIK